MIDHILTGFSFARTPLFVAEAMYRLNRYCHPTARLYAYKNRVIRLFHKAGYSAGLHPDLEVQLMRCRACGGTGIYYSDYGDYTDECNRCINGVYKRVLHYVFEFNLARPYRTLARYRWHQPVATVDWLPIPQAVHYLLSGYNPAYNPWLPHGTDWRDWPREVEWSKEEKQLRDRSRLCYGRGQISEDLWTVWWYLVLNREWIKPPMDFNPKGWLIHVWRWRVVYPIKGLVCWAKSAAARRLGIEQADDEIYYDLDPDEIPF
jgi:hypothetical protein